MTYKISKSDKQIKGIIRLDGSKSISNRVLIIRALSGLDFPIHQLSDSNDTQTLIRLLNTQESTLDAGPAGTTFRFMTAYLALREGTQLLTGSARMKQRPIGILVDCLQQLGAHIEYTEKDGYPPLRIHSPKSLRSNATLEIPANVSSQFISALLMIAPSLPDGLRLQLKGEIVSRPYIQMTLNTMARFGAKYTWEGNTISVPHQDYQAQSFTVEADWSAASYYYALAAFSDDTDLYLNGLFKESWQADAAIAKMMKSFGIITTFTEKGIRLEKKSMDILSFQYDFLNCPDIAQTLAVICAGKPCTGTLEGLQTLKIKETDRIQALINELAKIGVHIEEVAENTMQVHKPKTVHNDSIPTFETYHDHRMAMALAALSLVVEAVKIKDPNVVGKSYPAFWEDLKTLGFEVLRC